MGEIREFEYEKDNDELQLFDENDQNNFYLMSIRDLVMLQKRYNCAISVNSCEGRICIPKVICDNITGLYLKPVSVVDEELY